MEGIMTPDIWSLYHQMLRSRRFEELVARLWHQGLISGEMHLAAGEEAIVAGVVDQLEDGDAMALDHRGTPPLVMRGVDLVPLLREFLGRPDGLCSGMGGHMHLFSQEHLVASSGIVGASGPTAVGFALAAQYLRPGRVAICFFGEGAANQGMLLESMNLASAWSLPVLFVCKDNRWSFTTLSDTITGGRLVERARGFGIPAVHVDGTDVGSVWNAVHSALQRARDGGGPTFLLARCSHLEGHFLDDLFLHTARHPLPGIVRLAGPMARSILCWRGAPVRRRIGGLTQILSLIRQSRQDHVTGPDDPLVRARRRLLPEPDRLQRLEREVDKEMEAVFKTALSPIEPMR
jgi:pyruvate dehydrogenase E1 component alpha subunit